VAHLFQVLYFQCLAAPEGRPSVAQGETLGLADGVKRWEPWKGESRLRSRRDRRPSRAPVPSGPIPQGFTLGYGRLSMDPNRYEVSEPELLRGLRLS
jgi:hypothetical protein